MAVELKVRIQLEKTIGESFRLKPWESIEKVNFSDTEITALFNVAEVQETTRQVRIKKAGKRLVQWKLTERHMMVSGVPVPIAPYWKRVADETFWIESAPQEVHVKFGKHLTPAELDEQREWEKMCHRPGTGSTPLDSYQRVLDYKTAPKMERYW